MRLGVNIQYLSFSGKMKDKKIIVLVILSIAAVISLIYGIASPSKSKSRALRRSFSRGEVKNINSEKIETPFKRSAKRTGYSDWGRNPFVLPEIRDSLEVALNGILWDRENPRAIINNKNVKVGDKTGLYTVEEISKDTVVLTDGIRRLELRVE